MLHAFVRSSVIAFALVGCSLTTSLDGYTDGPVAPSPTRDLGEVDQSQTTPTDPKTPEPASSESGSSGSVTPESVSASYCASLPQRPTACLDFDGTPAISAGWDVIKANGGEVVTTDDAHSAKTAVELRISALDDPGSSAGAALQKGIVATGKIVQIGFDVRVVASNPTKKYDLLTIVTGAGADVYEIQIEQDNNGALYLVEKAANASERAVTLGQWLPAGANAPWTRIAITLDAATKHALVTVGSVKDLDVPLQSAPADLVNPVFIVGDNNQNDAPFTLRFDDIVANVPK